MRWTVALLIVLAASVLPSAAAATFDLGASKIVETALDPGEDAVLEMPLVVNQDGFLYAKVLPTPGNAVNDGTKANGSLVDGSGWSVTFELRAADGALTPMGTYVDSTVSTLVPVKLGDTPTLVMTVHVPADAARGGPQQKVYVAVAYRLNDGANSGASSGGVIDEARALTLVLSNALLPPAENGTDTGTGSDTATGADPATGTGTDTGSATGAETDTGTDTTPRTDTAPGTESEVQESTDPNPVQPIRADRPVQVYVEALPGWFLAGVLALGFALVAVLALMAAAVFALARRARREGEGDGEGAARAVPVRTEAARIGVVRKAEE